MSSTSGGSPSRPSTCTGLTPPSSSWMRRRESAAPFTAIPGLGETAPLSIVENRAGRTFISQEELLAACPKVSKTHVEQLRDAGALGSMPETSQISLF